MSDERPGSIPMVRPDPIVRVDGLAHLIFERPDLERAERFLCDFGLTVASRRDDALYLRAAGPAPHVLIVRRGATARYVGAAFAVRTRDELDVLARATGTGVEPTGEPGGGERVVLTDPAGFRVEVQHGVAPVAPLPFRTEPLPLNTPVRKPRVNAVQRPELRPAQVVRLGHLVLQATDFDATAGWYMRHLGLIPTDVQCLADGSPALAFMRCDRGAEPADHHTVVVFGGVANAYGHSAYEVLDIDELGMGQQVLKAGGWTHRWGIGRHILGSQLFDYWADPWGEEMEHYADGDVFDASYATNYQPLDPSLLWMWGQDVPADFGPKFSAGVLLDLAKRVLTGALSLDRLRLLKRIGDQPARPWLARR